MSRRTLSWVTVKRNNPGFRDTYGHWWLELDGRESFAWWGERCQLRVTDVIFGTNAVLNGVGIAELGGTPSTDPRHGETPDHAFHPQLADNRSDADLRAEVRRFAHDYQVRWGWPWWWSRQPVSNCHTFQDDLFAAVGLIEPPEFRYTRGPGCPYYYAIRRITWRVSDAWCMARGSFVGSMLLRDVDQPSESADSISNGPAGVLAMRPKIRPRSRLLTMFAEPESPTTPLRVVAQGGSAGKPERAQHRYQIERTCD